MRIAPGDTNAKVFQLILFAKLTSLVVALLFLMPALATAGWWAMTERPESWHSADWGSSGLLPLAGEDEEAAIYVLAARTGGLKGAFSVHCWIVLERRGADVYERYDKVGWGSPIRRNRYPADGLWYSNMPRVVHELHGEAAEVLLPKFDAAIASYPYADYGAYRIWPGPNSNTFVAHVLDMVPEFGARLPSNAVGRDYAPGLFTAGMAPGGRDFRLTFGGIAGFRIGLQSGVEVHLAGLVAGIQPRRLALLVPAWGSVAWQ